MSLVIPIGILLFFSKVDAVNTTFKHPVDFLVPGVLALAVMSTAMVSLGIATGYERRYGVLKRLGSTPLSRAGLLTAKTLNVLVIEVAQAIVIIGTGLALGWSTTGRLALAMGLLLVGTVAFAGIGLLMAGTLRAEANLAGANALFLVLLFLGGMAYPLGPPARGVGDRRQGTPRRRARGERPRGAQTPAATPTWSLAVLAAWAIGAPLVAARCFRWEE